MTLDYNLPTLGVMGIAVLLNGWEIRHVTFRRVRFARCGFAAFLQRMHRVTFEDCIWATTR